jgi:hypothetical protein
MSKRPRGRSESTACGCHWDDLLIEDVRGVIRAHLDLASAVSLGLTCRREAAALPARRRIVRREFRAKTHRLAAHAARSGYRDLYLWFMHTTPAKRGTALFVFGAQTGQLAFLQSFPKRVFIQEKVRQMLEIAADGGHLSVVEWLFGRLAAPSSHDVQTVADAAAAGGHMAVLQWAWDYPPIRGQRVIQTQVQLEAAAHGQLAVLRLLLEQKGQPLSCLVFESAARSGCLEVVRYLESMQCPVDRSNVFRRVATKWPSDAMMAHLVDERGVPMQGDAYTGCPLDLAHWQWLHAHDCPWSEAAGDSAMLRAVTAGALPCIAWLHETKAVPLHVSYIIRAADRRQADVMEWLLAHGCECSDAVGVALAKKGAFQLLQSLAERQLVDVTTQPILTKYAAAASQLNVLQWLRAAGCPWDEETWDAVRLVESNRALLQWLLAEGCPLGKE